MNALAPTSTGITTALKPAFLSSLVRFKYFALLYVWASSILLSYGTANSTIKSNCVEDEWIRISGFNLVSLSVLGWLFHSGRSSETSQSSHPSSRHFLWFVDLTPPLVPLLSASFCGQYDRICFWVGTLSFSHAYHHGKFLKDSAMPP